MQGVSSKSTNQLFSNQNIYKNSSENYKDYREKQPAFFNGKILEITGHLRKKHEQPQAKSYSKFQRVKVKILPDTGRVLIPSKDHTQPQIPIHQRTKSKITQNSKEFNYISNVYYNVKIRPISSNIKESYDFNHSNPNAPLKDKRQNKSTPYTSYSTTSQIFNLPGCVKRNEKDVMDDIEEIKINNQRMRNRCSYKAKVQNDYYTNISCLPGCPLNPKGENKRSGSNGMRNICKMNESDIFNLRKGPLCKEEGRLKNSKKRIFPEKNNVTSPQSTFARLRNRSNVFN